MDPKVLSWGNSYNIYDGSGQIKYQVQAAIFSIGRLLVLFDKTIGQEKGQVENKFFRIPKEFEIRIGRKSHGTVKKRFPLFHPKYVLDFRGWRTEGDIQHGNYSIYEDSRCVAHISKELVQQGERYVLDIDNEQDEIPALMVIITMYRAITSNLWN